MNVTIVCITHRASQIDFLLSNIIKQNVQPNDVHIVCHGFEIKGKHKLSNLNCLVHVYSLSKKCSLGYCLNYAIKRTKTDIVVKFDDDDIYGSGYIQEVVTSFKEKNVDIVGKLGGYIYFLASKNLMIWNESEYNVQTSVVKGATIAFRKKLTDKVNFRSVNKGEDSFFLKDSLKVGASIYASSTKNFCVVRYDKNHEHTWKVDENAFRKSGRYITGSYELTDVIEYID